MKTERFDMIEVAREVLGIPRLPRPERRDLSEAGCLRRAAFRFEQRGQTASAILLNNAAYILEHPEEPVNCFPKGTP